MTAIFTNGTPNITTETGCGILPGLLQGIPITTTMTGTVIPGIPINGLPAMIGIGGHTLLLRGQANRRAQVTRQPKMQKPKRSITATVTGITSLPRRIGLHHLPGHNQAGLLQLDLVLLKQIELLN